MELQADTNIFRYKTQLGNDGAVELDCQDPDNHLDMPEWKSLKKVLTKHSEEYGEDGVRAEFDSANMTTTIYVNPTIV